MPLGIPVGQTSVSPLPRPFLAIKPKASGAIAELSSILSFFRNYDSASIEKHAGTVGRAQFDSTLLIEPELTHK
jgi:hypothetical protein